MLFHFTLGERHINFYFNISPDDFNNVIIVHSVIVFFPIIESKVWSQIDQDILDKVHTFMSVSTNKILFSAGWSLFTMLPINHVIRCGMSYSPF